VSERRCLKAAGPASTMTGRFTHWATRSCDARTADRLTPNTTPRRSHPWTRAGDFSPENSPAMENQVKNSSASAKLVWAENLARELMAKHGLLAAGWSFRFNQSVRHTGLSYGPPACRIELSKYFVQRNPPEKVRGTLLHEIAHAKTSPAMGHSPEWLACCLAIGGDPDVLVDADMPKGQWSALCPGCRTVYYRKKAPAGRLNYYCPCGPVLGRLYFTRTATHRPRGAQARAAPADARGVPGGG
jgi:SprT-like family